MFGYAGKLLYVDLEKGTTRKRVLDSDLARKYVGGAGLAAKLLYDSVSEAIDPLSPKNVIVFASGPFTGTLLPMSGKWEVGAISPLTGIWGEANCGAWWGAELKFAGYDGLVIQGKSESPVYIFIDDDQVHIRSAKDIWGQSTSKTMSHLMKIHGGDIPVACIGQAGENLIKIASIISEHGGAAARCGLGAVMGSKNLKAVAVRGSKEIPFANLSKFMELVTKIKARIRENPTYVDMSKYGTGAWTESGEEIGDLPIKYWEGNEWLEGSREISGTTTVKRYPVKGIACYACSVGCGTAVKIAFRSNEREWYFGPEYETLACFGSLCLNSDFKSIINAQKICDDYGIDCISTGGLVAFAMACKEKGLIPAEYLNGIDLSWGNTATITTLVEMIAKKESIGKILSEGVRGASHVFGEEASRLAVHVKGLAPAMHDPRGKPGFALLYATSPIGASHGRGHVSLFDRTPYTPDEVAEKGFEGQNVAAFVDSAVLCKFGPLMKAFSLSDVAEMLTHITGWNTSEVELRKTGERIVNLKRLINLRQGMTSAQDTLPGMFLKTPRIIDKQKVVVQDHYLNEAIHKFYQLHGWNEEGIPTEEKLRELGLLE
jgi:aldehyde:ferredoxin oxidoreductase